MGFWIFIGLVVLAITYEEVEQKKSRARLLQTALEKGKDLDPQLLDRLFPGEYSRNAKSADPRGVRITAVVVASIGVGFGVLAVALKQIHINHFWSCLGVGGLTLVTSVGIYIASRMMAARQQADSSSLQSQT